MNSLRILSFTDRKEIIIINNLLICVLYKDSFLFWLLHEISESKFQLGSFGQVTGYLLKLVAVLSVSLPKKLGGRLSQGGSVALRL